MENQHRSEKPEGFAKWLGWILLAVLLGMAGVIFFYQLNSDHALSSNPVESSQGIKLNL